MAHQPEGLTLLRDPVAEGLLACREPARFAYTWTDGTPRVVPIWFHWNGSAVVLGTPVRAPKLRALPDRPDVAVTIDDATTWPYRALLIRGVAAVDVLDSVTPEYEAAATRYLGAEQARSWVGGLRDAPMARITIEPRHVSLLDFVNRFPSALSS